MLEPCKCVPGWCTRHQVEKSQSDILRCRTDLQYRKYLDKGCVARVEFPVLTIADLSKDVLNLIKYIEKPSVIIGVSRSGIIPASILSTTLNLPLWSISQKTGEILNLRGGIRFQDEPCDGIIYIVDDSSWTGKAFKESKLHVQKKFPNNIIKTLCVYKSKITNTVDICDIVLRHHFFEWNMHNSVFSIAYDLDGVLCRDFTIEEDSSEPLYLKTMSEMTRTKIQPVKENISIITGRLEKYRAETELWLNQNGFKIKSLIMAPWDKAKTLEETAKWKAEMFIENFPHYQMYCESSRSQAEIIFKNTRKAIMCVETGVVLTTDYDLLP